MAHVIGCIGVKGGVGKTTTAAWLATSLAASGAEVVVLDADPQGGAVTWAEAWQAAWTARQVPIERLREVVEALTGLDAWLIVDSAPRAEDAMRVAALCDVAVVPTTLSPLVAGPTEALLRALLERGVPRAVMLRATLAHAEAVRVRAHWRAFAHWVGVVPERRLYARAWTHPPEWRARVPFDELARFVREVVGDGGATH